MQRIRTTSRRRGFSTAPLWWVGVALIVAELALKRSSTTHILELLRFVDVALALGYPLWVGAQLLRSSGSLVTRLAARRADVMFGGFVLTLLLVSSESLAGPLVILRWLSGVTVRWLSSVSGDRVARYARLRPPQTAAVGFALLIAAGTLLLASPLATRDGEGLGFLEALFTITSAVTVTGLAVVAPASALSLFGQAIVLGAMQVGAIGIMVLGAALVFALGGQLPQRREEGLRVLLEVRTGETLRRLIGAVTTTTVVAEASGTLFLYVLWWLGGLPLNAPYDDAAGALWWSVFHAVSAFCNAGFSLSPHSLEAFVGNPLVCAIFAALITIGGLGFAVLSDLAQDWRGFWSRPRWTWRRLQLQTRVVLSMTLLLDGVGFLCLLFLEFDDALAAYPLGTKVGAALFQAVSLRTAGFNTIPLEGILPATTVLMVTWMFIGAGPGSTAGGVKVTTTATVLFAVRAMLRSRDDVELFGRALPKTTVYRSIAIVFVAALAVALFLSLLATTQPGLSFEALLFEVVSALGTVGLSLGVTSQLDTVGQTLVIVLMYLGRLGPLTLALAVAERPVPRGYRLAEGHLAVG